MDHYSLCPALKRNRERRFGVTDNLKRHHFGFCFFEEKMHTLIFFVLIANGFIFNHEKVNKQLSKVLVRINLFRFGVLEKLFNVSLIV